MNETFKFTQEMFDSGKYPNATHQDIGRALTVHPSTGFVVLNCFIGDKASERKCDVDIDFAERVYKQYFLLSLLGQAGG